MDSGDRAQKAGSRLAARRHGARRSAANNAEAGAEEEEEVVTPVLDTGELSPGSGTSLLLRPVDNSPFSSRARRDKSASSDNLSTPYSQISGISTYEDYEDDFTSDESEFSALTNKSKARSSSQSKIPIKRSSSLHRRSGIIKNGSSVADRNPGTGAAPPPAVPQPPLYVPEMSPAAGKEEPSLPRPRDTEVVAAADIGSAAADTPKTPTSLTTAKLSRGKASPRKLSTRTKSVSPHLQQPSRPLARQELEARLATARSTSDLPQAEAGEEREAADSVDEKRTFPATEPPKRRSYSHSVSVPGRGGGGPGRSYSSVVGASRRSTAGSVSSTTSIQVRESNCVYIRRTKWTPCRHCRW